MKKKHYLCLGVNQKHYKHLKNKVMKTAKKVTLNNVRNEFKNQSGTLSFCLKTIYAAIEQAKEDDQQAENLKKIMPKSKVEAYNHCEKIAAFAKIGEQKTVKRTVKACETTYTITIKPTVDAVLRYFTKVANGEL